jgi:hypothetical protein
MKYAAAIIITLILFAGGFFTGSYFNRKPGKTTTTTDTLTVVRDTVIFKDKIVYRDRIIPTPVPGIPFNFYSDTLKTDSLDLVINDSIRGELISRVIEHKPIIFERVVTEVKYVPTPVIKLKSPTLSVYGDIKTGGGANGFVGAIELGIINKNRNKLGASVFRSNSTYFCISYGYVLPIY